MRGVTGLLLGVLLAAMNLRVAFTSVGPVLADIRGELGLSGALASLLAALPVVCLGLLAPLAPVLSRRLGVERAIGVALAALAVGLVVRSVDGFASVVLGTVVVGGSIAVGNVLLPVIVKRDFPDRAGRMTGLYTAAMGVMAAIAAALTIPLGSVTGLGWRGGLAAWAIPALAAALVWLPKRGARPSHAGAAPPGGAGRLLRDPLAWQVTVYLGLQSLGFYTIVAWLPSIYRDLGVPPGDAGLLAAIIPLVGLLGGLTIPAWASGSRDQRAAAFLVAIGTAAGLLGIMLAPLAAPVLWVVVVGVCQGAGFPLALTLIVLRTRSPAETQRLSAMTQALGYLIAASGPLLVGAVHDATRTWFAPVGLLIVLALAQAIAGLGAGRARFVAGGTEG